MDPEIERFITLEIVKQLHPVGKQMDAVLISNEEQNRSLEGIKKWMHEFYGNGSGRKGEWEKRRHEDDERYQKLFVLRNEVELEKARKEERAAVLAEVAAQKDGKGRMRREWLLILATAGASAGAFVLVDGVKFIFSHLVH